MFNRYHHAYIINKNSAEITFHCHEILDPLPFLPITSIECVGILKIFCYLALAIRFTYCTDTTCITPEAQTQSSGNQKNRRIRPKLSMILWKKGQKLLNMFWRTWPDGWLLSLHEITQRTLKSGRIQSAFRPNVGDVVLVKEAIPHGRLRIRKVVSLVQSQDGCLWAANVSLPSWHLIGRPSNLPFPIEVSGNSRSDENQESNSTEKKEST